MKNIFKENLDLEVIEYNIYVLHNFVLAEESQVYLDIANSVNEELWWQENSGWYKGKYLNLSDKPIIKQISENIIERFSKVFSQGEKYTFGSPSSIHRMTKGQDMFVHADFSETDDIDEDVILFNTAIYHNDVLGGEIYYPEIGVEYHPVQGDIVIHPGNTKYRHGVKPVLDQTRYISTLWGANDKGLQLKTSGSYTY